MTSEQRLDRLERIAKLMVKAGLCQRKTVHEHNELIRMLLNAQIKTDDAMARLAQSQAQLADSQAHSDRRLNALIDIVRRREEGQAST